MTYTLSDKVKVIDLR